MARVRVRSDSVRIHLLNNLILKFWGVAASVLPLNERININFTRSTININLMFNIFEICYLELKSLKLQKKRF
jgi:hypothetical protein